MDESITFPDGVKGDETQDADERLVAFGGTIKALDDDGRVGGYLVAFGGPEDKDLQGEYFTKDTDFHLEDYPVVGERVLYHHGLDPQIGVKAIGKITDMRMDDVGIWVEAQLKKADDYARAIFQMIKQGKLGWSSGALPQSYRAAPDGHILSWAILEGSTTPTPAQPFKTRITNLKSLLSETEAEALKGLMAKEAPVETEDELPEPVDADRAVVSAEGEAPDVVIDVPAIKSEAQPLPTETPAMEQTLIQSAAQTAVQTVLEAQNLKMSDEEVTKFVAQASEVLGAMIAEKGDSEESDDARMMKAIASSDFAKKLADIASQINAVRNQQIAESVKANLGSFSQPQSRVNGYQAPAQPRIQVRSKFADMSAQDMHFLHVLRKAASRRRDDYDYRPSIEFTRELLDKAQKAYQSGELRVAEDDTQTLWALTAIKANELDSSAQAGFGDEWVPNIWSSDLWERARLENVVLSRMRTVEMPSNPFELPVESSDPTVYYVSETTNEDQLALDNSNSPIPDSKVGTNKVTLTAGKLGLRIGISAEVEEDSIIPFIANTRRQALRTMMDAIDNVILNGDTETGTTNINYDGAPVVAGSKFLIFDGLIKNPLVTAPSNAVDAGGATPTLSLLRQVRGKLQYARAADLRNLMWIVDFPTYLKLLAIDEVSSAANRGSAPTGVTGVLGGIDGVDLFVSNEMALADTDGKVTAAGNSTDRGRALLVHRGAWVVGYRRRVTSSLEFFPVYDSYQMTATVRIALINQDNDSTAIAYNLAI